MSMFTMFVDREEELKFLEDKYESSGFECILVYGRRRVGKTELLTNFIKDKKSIYHLVAEEEGQKQLERLKYSFYQELGGTKPEVEDWVDLFKYISQWVPDRTVIVIDEFPYLVQENSSLPSYFQKFIDEYLKDRNLMLILCGSSISMMEDLKSYKNPLYGRRTGQIDLKPFNFQESRKMMEGRTIESQIKLYSVFGGVPHYLQRINQGSVNKNIKREICKPEGMLHEEPEILLRQEFRKPNRYFTILESIAKGKTKPSTITDDSGIPSNSISKYLEELQKVRIIGHHLPVTERRKRSRKGIYKINDNLFSFWFRFIAPNLSDLEEDYEGFFDAKIAPELNHYVSRKFESICKEAIRIMNRKKELRMNKIGKWWYRDNEIDIVALNKKKKEILFGECKWSKNPVNKKILANLEKTAEEVRWNGKDRKEKYTLFSKSGFTEELEELAKNQGNLELYSLEDLEKIF